MCIWVCAHVCMCALIFHCGSFTLLYVIFLLPLLWAKHQQPLHGRTIHTRAHWAHYLTFSLTHTHAQAGTQRNAAPQDSVSSATTLHELQRSATGKWQLSMRLVAQWPTLCELRLWVTAPRALCSLTLSLSLSLLNLLFSAECDSLRVGVASKKEKLRQQTCGIEVLEK